MGQLRATDPGLAIAASVPVHRLGSKEEVAGVVTMYVDPVMMFKGTKLTIGGQVRQDRIHDRPGDLAERGTQVNVGGLLLLDRPGRRSQLVMN